MWTLFPYTTLFRSAYRDLSKLYHPDTTAMPPAIATTKFQQLNEAYATLSSPERRLVYDQKNGYSRVVVAQPLPSLNQPTPRTPSYPSSSAYLDPTDRPLSAGEVFAVFILGLTVVGCLVLAIAIGITRGDTLLQPITAQTAPSQPTTAAISVAKPYAESVPPLDSPVMTLPKSTVLTTPSAELVPPKLDGISASHISPVPSSPHFAPVRDATELGSSNQVSKPDSTQTTPH